MSGAVVLKVVSNYGQNRTEVNTPDGHRTGRRGTVPATVRRPFHTGDLVSKSVHKIETDETWKTLFPGLGYKIFIFSTSFIFSIGVFFFGLLCCRCSSTDSGRTIPRKNPFDRIGEQRTWNTSQTFPVFPGPYNIPRQFPLTFCVLDSVTWLQKSVGAGHGSGRRRNCSASTLYGTSATIPKTRGDETISSVKLCSSPSRRDNWQRFRDGEIH